MKKTNVGRELFSGLWLVGMILSPSAAETDRWSLDRCTSWALENSPILRLAQDDLTIARARRRVATVSLAPVLSVKADETTGRADQGADNPAFAQRSYGLSLSQTVFSGGKIWNAHRQSSLSAEVARLQYDKQKLDIRHAVLEAYYRVVALTRAVEVHRATNALLKEDLEKAVRHELSNARSARIELLSTRAQARESDASLAEAEGDLMEARSALLDAVGERFPRALETESVLPNGEVSVDEEEALRVSRLHRPEMKLADRLMESARLSRAVGRTVYFPKIEVNGFWGKSASAYIDTEPMVYKKDWNLGLSAQWALLGSTVKGSAFRDKTSPRLGESTRTESETRSVAIILGDGLSAGVGYREGVRSYHEEEWRYEKTRREMDNQVRLAVKRLAQAKSRWDAAKARWEEAQQEFRDTQALLQDDRGHLGHLAAARQRSALAQAQAVSAQAHYWISVSALNRAVGVPDQFRGKS